MRYFTLMGKNKKLDSVSSNIITMTEEQRALTQQQLLMLQKQKERNDELHSLLVEEKSLDVKIKRAQLRLVEKQLEQYQ